MDEIRQGILREQEARKARFSAMLNTSFEENEKKNDVEEDEIEKEVKKSESDEFNKAYSELFGEDSIEKAKHQIGDSHPKWPQLKWTDLGGGKFGWRTGTGRGKRAAGNAGGQSNSGGNASQASQTSQAKPAKTTTTKEKTDNNKAGSQSSIPTTVADALKQASVDTDEIKTEAKRVNLARSKARIEQFEVDIKRAESELKYALSTGDPNRIKGWANDLASKKLYLEEYKKNLAAKKKERKQFLDSTGRDFTEDQVQEYLDNYITDKTHSAVVHNEGYHYMGRIQTTIEVGQGKAKDFNLYNFPSWRPIGMIEYSTVKVPVQSWDDIKKNLSSTEKFTLYLYKHPKQ